MCFSAIHNVVPSFGQLTGTLFYCRPPSDSYKHSTHIYPWLQNQTCYNKRRVELDQQEQTRVDYLPMKTRPYASLARMKPIELQHRHSQDTLGLRRASVQWVWTNPFVKEIFHDSRSDGFTTILS